MALCRFGLLRSCSHLQVSSLSLAALKQNSSNLCVSRYGGPNETRLSHLNLMSMQCLTGASKAVLTTTEFSPQTATMISQPKPLPGTILESFLSQKSNMSRDMIQRYICPSKLTDNNLSIVILDNITSITNFYDCPVSTIIDNIKMPSQKKSEISDGPDKRAPKMEAKIIMKIRHKKMKKHKLKKLRKRMYHVWRKHRMARKARRMKLYHKELEEIKKSGDDFNPLDFVQQQIAKAKKGGYGISIFDSKDVVQFYEMFK